MNRKKRYASLLRISEVFSHLRLEPQMTFRTAIQTDYIFIDQFASLSADHTPRSDSPEEIQHGSGCRTDGRADNSQRTSGTCTANHADNHDSSSCGNPGCGSNRTGLMKRVRNRSTIRTKDFRHSNDSFFQVIKPATEAAGVHDTPEIAPLFSGGRTRAERRGLLPEFRRFAVQSKQSGQAAVALVGTGGTVLFGGFGEGVQQAPPGRLDELLMPGMFELLPDGQNIT